MFSGVRSPKMKKGENSENFTRQGSLRRVLPAQPKDNLFGRHNEDLNKLYKSFHQEYVILAEYKMVQTENIQGVYVIPSRESPFVWFGVIFVRSGPYEDGIFRFTVVLDENFPDSEHPKVVFLTEIYHPMVDFETNELNLLHGFPNWRKSEQHIWQVLKYVYWVFYNVGADLNAAVNKEAVDLFRDNINAFNVKISEIVKSSQEHIYDELPGEDKHHLIFEPYNPVVHDDIRKSMLEENIPNSMSGYSWVLPGSFRPLGRPSTPDSESES